MRIRSIKPEFYTSEDIACLTDWCVRLLFIGLWSYVDDNGVGRDVEKLIVADLFPLEDDPRETLARVSEGLRTLSEHGRITRYVAGGRPFLYITNWDKHQKIDHPGKPRYPLPTREDAQITRSVPQLSRESRDEVAPGTGEQGNRGVRKKTSSSAVADGLFDAFWKVYPRKVSKQDARKKWDVAIRDTDPQVIIEGAKLYAAYVERENTEKDKIKHPDGWIHGRRWEDDLDAEPTGQQPKGFFTPPPPPADMPGDLFSVWNRAHVTAWREGRPGPSDWHELQVAS